MPLNFPHHHWVLRSIPSLSSFPHFLNEVATVHSLSSCDSDNDDMQPPAHEGTHVSAAPALASIPENDVAGSTLSPAQMDHNRSLKPLTPKPATGQATSATSSAGRTPVQANLDSGERTKNGANSKASVENYLQKLLGDKVKRDFPVIEFIEAVWGLPWTGIQSPEGGYKLKEAAVLSYIDNRYHKAMDIKTEESAYGPLQEIIEDIVEQIASAYPVLGTKASFVNLRDRVVTGFFAKFKPDFLWSWLRDSEGAKHSWLLAALCGELKKDVMKKFEFQTTVDMTMLEKYTRTIPLPTDSTKARNPPTATHHDHDTQTLATPTGILSTASQHTTPAQPSSIESVTKRKRSEDDDSRTPVAQHTKRIRSGDGPTLPLSVAPPSENADQESTADGNLSPNELQIVRYLNEAGSHGIRSYVTGFLIENCDVTLWYIDRMGVIKSSSFNFVTESHIFVYFIASISLASFSQLGICSLLKLPEGRTAPSDLASVFGTYQGVALRLRMASGIGARPLANLFFSLAVSSERRIVPTYGSVGRASTIVPIEADTITHRKLNRAVQARETKKDSSSESAAAPEDAVPSIDRKATAPVKLVAKISWQSRWRKGEDFFIRKIHEKVSEVKIMRRFLDNVVDMKCSADYSIRSGVMSLPRAKMVGMLDPVYERVCRVLVLREYIPLHKIKTPDQFKTIFIDVVQAHHAVYVTTNILHRDISPNNIMWYYRDDDPRSQVVGVLCDWDLAREQPQPSLNVIVADLKNCDKDIPEAVPLSFDHLASHQPAMQPTVHQPDGIVADAGAADEERHEPRYRTGTGPFIALDILLYKHVPYHLYRHDLESFFWVLVWFLVCFDPVEGKLKYIDSWLQPSLALIGAAKVGFFSNLKIGPSAFISSVHSTYKDIYVHWVNKLKPLIKSVYTPYKDHILQSNRASRPQPRSRPNKRAPASANAATQAVEKLVEDRENVLTFESFMKCLGVST